MIIRVNRGSRRQIYKIKQSATTLKSYLRSTDTKYISYVCACACVRACMCVCVCVWGEGEGKRGPQYNQLTIQDASIRHGCMCINVFGIVSINDTRLALHLSGREGDGEIVRSLDRRECVRLSGPKDSGGVVIERSLRAMIRENLLGESHLRGGAAGSSY